MHTILIYVFTIIQYFREGEKLEEQLKVFKKSLNIKAKTRMWLTMKNVFLTR